MHCNLEVVMIFPLLKFSSGLLPRLMSLISFYNFIKLLLNLQRSFFFHVESTENIDEFEVEFEIIPALVC